MNLKNLEKGGKPKLQALIDYGSIVAFVLFSFGILNQVVKTYKSKSVKDISLLEVGCRTLGGYAIEAKVISTHDLSLIIGNTAMTVAITIYCLLVVKYKISQRS